MRRKPASPPDQQPRPRRRHHLVAVAANAAGTVGLSFLPAVLLMMTSFTRLIIVLSLLRSALGLQGSPPNMVLIGLALFMTLFIMTPTFDRVYTEAYQPFDSKQIDFREALDKGQAPMKDFMLRQTRESDLALFMRLAGTPPVSRLPSCRCAWWCPPS